MADFDVSAVFPGVLNALNAEAAADLDGVTQAELYEYADELLQRIARAYGIFAEYDDTTAVAANQADYDYPARHLGTVHMALDGLQLRPATVAEVEALDSNFEAATGTPTRFIGDYQGVRGFRVYKVPTSSGTIALIFLRHVPALSSIQTRAPIPAPLGDMLAFRMIGDARRKDTDAQMPEAAEFCARMEQLYGQILGAYWGGGM